MHQPAAGFDKTAGVLTLQNQLKRRVPYVPSAFAESSLLELSTIRLMCLLARENHHALQHNSRDPTELVITTLTLDP